MSEKAFRIHAKKRKGDEKVNCSCCTDVFDLLKKEDINAAADLRKIDNDCSSCMYEAAMLTEKDVLEAVITNELNEFEQLVVRLHWFSDFSYNRIAGLYGVSKETVRRYAEKAKEKIYTSMKYVVLYDTLIDGRQPVPDDFHFKIVRCIDGKELIS